ncbi:MAG: hypothetical protein FJX59_14375 [Alphaproteobacteria bacterium]|nr:hypothetical protein [Alphaproteobacteria bacterium]
MARKPRAARPSREAPASDTARLAEAVLAEAAAMGWRETTLAGVADRAGLSLDRVNLVAPTKAYLPLAVIDLIDHDALGNAKPDAASSPRDRLFELLMKRCDALQKRRNGIKALIKGVLRDPPVAAMMALRLNRSLAATLAVAGISADGLMGCARVLGLKAVFAATMRAWLKDESADMSKTMPALDRALNMAERVATMTSRKSKQES